MPDQNGKPYYQVIRTKITESTLPNQVMEIATTESVRMAESLAATWKRYPTVRAGHEVVRIVER